MRDRREPQGARARQAGDEFQLAAGRGVYAGARQNTGRFANRDQAAMDRKLEELREVARGDGNLLFPIKEALRAGGSIGEVCNAMRDVFGEYRGGAFF